MQGLGEEIGRKVMVLGERMNNSRHGMLNSTSNIQLDVEDMKKLQKVIDMIDAISQMVCDSDENSAGRARSAEGEKLLAEIVSLRAAQLALIQDDFDSAFHSIEEVKTAFSEIGFLSCHGLLDGLVRQIVAEKREHAKRQRHLDKALHSIAPGLIREHHSRRGEAILKCAEAALSTSRFDHALAFIVKSKRAFLQSDKPEMLTKLQDLNRTVVVEATRMASDSLILEATRTETTQQEAKLSSSMQQQAVQQSSMSNKSNDDAASSAASDASTEAQHMQTSSEQMAADTDALFSPHNETRKIIQRIDNGGRVALDQEQDELEDEIQRLRLGLEASKSHLKSDLVPIHRKSATATPTKATASAPSTVSPHARRAQQSSLRGEASVLAASGVDQVATCAHPHVSHFATTDDADMAPFSAGEFFPLSFVLTLSLFDSAAPFGGHTQPPRIYPIGQASHGPSRERPKRKSEFCLVVTGNRPCSVESKHVQFRWNCWYRHGTFLRVFKWHFLT